MIPGLESIPELERHHFCGSDSDSDSRKKSYNTSYIGLLWFRGLEPIPESDFHHGYDSNSCSDSNKKQNHNTSSLCECQGV